MSHYRSFASTILGLLLFVASPRTVAQLIPDNTLGTENSTVTPLDLLNDRINGGASRGINLFHSFLEFNVGNGRSAYFANPAGIENILTRVTGSNASNILGTLGVLGDANLFLINPNGIYFGPDARLDVSGSFLATTADGIQLGSQGYFSAADPQNSQLLSVQPGALFSNAMRNYQAEIRNQGNLAAGENLTLDADNLTLQGQLQAGENLRLQATDTVKIRDSVATPFIAAAGNRLLVQGNQNVDIFALNHPNSGLYSGGEMVLRSPNSIIGDAHYYSGGNFRIEKLDGSLGNLTSPNDPVIRSLGDVSFSDYAGTSLHIFAAGSVNISGFVVIQNPDPINGIVENVTLSNGTTVAIDGQNESTLDIRAGMDAAAVGIPGLTGTGLFVTIPAITFTPSSADISIRGVFFNPQPGTLLLSNQYRPNSALPGGTITVGAIGNFGISGDGGNIFIDSRAGINLTNDINTFSLAGNGGNVLLNANGDINASNISTFGGSLGGGGDIAIATSGDVFFDGSTLISNTNGLAQAGDISVTARSVQLANSARLIASTNGAGNAGNAGSVEIVARDTVSFDNSSAIAKIEPGATGNGGDINIATGSLIMSNSARLDTTISGMGNGGSINIFARDTVSLDGVNNNLPTAALTNVEPNAMGNAGNVSIEARSLSVTNGALLESRTRGQGDAANIDITVREQVNFSGSNSGWNSGAYSSVELGAAGNGGDVNINTGSLSLANGAQINASALGAGNAGNVNIAAVDAVSFNNSRVEAGAIGGNGGDININAGSLSLTNVARLNASTLGAGDSGNVNIAAVDAVSFNNSRVEAGAIGGNGGDINIDAGSLSLANVARLNTSALGVGNSGNVNIVARGAVSFDNSRALSIMASSVPNAGGDVNIDAASLSLTNGAILNTSTFGEGDAGGVNITARDRVSFDNSLAISGVETGAVGTGGDIEIDAGSLSFTNNTQLIVGTRGVGDSGNVRIAARDGVSFDSSRVVSRVEPGAVGSGGDIEIAASSLSLINKSELTASSEGLGDAGNVNLTVRDSIFFDDSRVFSSMTVNALGVPGVGNGGDVNLNAGSLFLSNGAALAASTLGQGDAGDVNITVRSAVSLDGVGSNGLPTTITSSVLSDTFGNRGVGKGGDVNLNAGSLSITNNAAIAASTFGEGDAGNVNINVRDTVSLDGSSNGLFRSSITSGVFPDLLNNPGVGDGGDVNIEAGSLSLSNGAAIASSTFGMGNAGNVDLKIRNTVSLDGVSRDGLPTTISSSVLQDVLGTPGVGDGGNVTLEAGSLSLSNGAAVLSSTEGVGNAGDVKIAVRDNASLSDSFISSAVEAGAEGNGGSINFNARSLSLTNSQVSAFTAGRGNAGSAIVNANDAIALDNSTVSSAVETGGIGNGANAELRGNSLSLNNSQVFSSTAGRGNAGSAVLNANDAIALNNSTISSAVEAGGVGNGANAELTANSLSLTNNSRVSSSTAGRGNAGSAILNANDAIALDNSTVSSAVEAGGIGNGANAELRGNALSLTNSRVSSSTAGRGNAGSAVLNANDAIALDNSTVSSATSGQGDAGSATITATHAIALNNSIVSSAVEVGGVGNGANAELRGNSLSLTNSRVSSSTAGRGNAGSAVLNANDAIALNNSTVSSAVESGGVGNGANAELTANSLSLTNNSRVSSSTAGRGNAGSAILNANHAIALNNSTVSSAVETTGIGNGGRVSAETRVLSMNNGSQFSSSTAGRGDAGQIALSASDSVTLDNSAIFNRALDTATGNGGDIDLGTGELTMNDSRISSDNLAAGTAGNINLQLARNLRLNRSQITATTASGDGGNLNFQINDNFVLRNGSLISTTAGQAGAGGNGGNINIAGFFIVGVPWENSDITANAFEGRGGNITITTNGIYGLQFRPRLTPLSDITASSEFGLNGSFILNLLSFPAERGLNQLPESPVDAESLVGRDACTVQGGQIAGGSSFALTGRGGLPVDAAEELPTLGGIVEWATRGGNRTEATAGNLREPTGKNEFPQDIRPVQGWVMQADGTVILTAEASTANFSSPDRLTTPNCHVFQRSNR